LFPSFAIFVAQLNNPLSNISQGMNSFQYSVAAIEKIFEFLNEPEEKRDLSNKKLKKVRGSVELSNVEFSYNDDKKIINNFSVKIKPGMKVAIVGPTGAGKTTIVNLLMRFYEINKGSIAIDGVNVQDMRREYLRSLFGMVLQDS
jgi:ATP-binding cassette subfamily B protein